MAVPIEIYITAGAYILLFLGIIVTRFSIFKSFGSMLLIIMGIITYYPGFSGINSNTLTGLTLGSINIGLGFYFLLEPYFSHDKQAEIAHEEIEDGRYHD